MGESGGDFGVRRRIPRGTALTQVLICAVSLLAMNGDATGIVNPHDTTRPKYCLNCHTEDIYSKNCNEPEGYCLLGGSVDGICLTCHIREECCKPGLEHLRKIHLGQRNHPTDVDIRDIPPAYHPKTLPVQNGRITCRTCHLHSRERPDGYKMLRLVKITGQGVDWTVLCQDCHKEK